MVRGALVRVFTNFWYSVSAVVLALLIAVVTLLWANFDLLVLVWQSELTSLEFKFSLTGQLLLGATASMGVYAVTVIITTAVLIGIVASMSWYAWQSKQSGRELQLSFTSSGAGLFAALLGIGCVACGPLLVTSLLALVGGAGLLLVLPLHGAEFGLLALLLLLYAIYTLAKVITAPAICVMLPNDR